MPITTDYQNRPLQLSREPRPPRLKRDRVFITLMSGIFAGLVYLTVGCTRIYVHQLRTLDDDHLAFSSLLIGMLAICLVFCAECIAIAYKGVANYTTPQDPEAQEAHEAFNQHRHYVLFITLGLSFQLSAFPYPHGHTWFWWLGATPVIGCEIFHIAKMRKLWRERNRLEAAYQAGKPAAS
jgi:hypothetical protein